jgi:Ulp1 family protease
MAAIANQNGGHMVQHVLLPVNIHFHWNLFVLEFLTIYFDFILEKGGFKIILDSFHQTSSNFVGISTVWQLLGVEQIQNGGYGRT